MAEAAIGATKRCPKCSITKPATIEFFSREPKLAYGLSCWCKACEKVGRDQRKARDPDIYKKNWDKRKDDGNAARRGLDAIRRRGPEREAILAREQERRNLRRDIRNAKSKINRAPKQAELNRRERERLRNNPERKARKNAQCEAWRRANRERARVYVRNRRAAIKAGGRHTKEDIDAIYAVQSGCCFYCKGSLTDYHVDHYVPVSRGGTNSPENLVIACPICNRAKADKMPEEYIRSIGGG